MANKSKMITTAEGVYVHVGDLKAALDNEQYVLECAAMIKVAKLLNHAPLMGVRMCILAAIDGATGIEPLTQAQANARKMAARIVIEEGGRSASGGDNDAATGK